MRSTLQRNRKIEEFIEKTLLKDCSEICETYKQTKKALLRGSYHEYAFGKLIQPRENRRPKDTDPLIHELADDVFDRVFHWKPRSSGVFCTSNRDNIGEYGEANYIFPVNGFKFLWSPDIEDFYADVVNFRLYEPDVRVISCDLNNERSYRYEEMKAKKMTKEEYTKYAINMYKIQIRDDIQNYVLKYKETNLKAAIMSRNEVMIKCKGYYAIECQSYLVDKKIFGFED